MSDRDSAYRAFAVLMDRLSRYDSGALRPILVGIKADFKRTPRRVDLGGVALCPVCHGLPTRNCSECYRACMKFWLVVAGGMTTTKAERILSTATVLSRLSTPVGYPHARSRRKPSLDELDMAGSIGVQWGAVRYRRGKR